MVNRRLLWMVCGFAAVALALVPRAGATSNEHKTTYLTFSHPLSLPGVARGSGTYVFEIANPASGADLVGVASSFTPGPASLDVHRRLNPVTHHGARRRRPGL